MPQRITTIVTSLALIGAIFAGVPSSARAVEPATKYVGIVGADYTKALVGCRDLDVSISSGAAADASEGVSVASDEAGLGGTVYLCPGTYHFQTAAAMQNNDITLKGAGVTQTILDGGGISRIIITGGNLSIESLTMENAYEPGFMDGAAVLAEGNVDVLNATFANNYADKAGAAIAALGTVTVSGGTFNNNTSADQGGAIASYSFVRVTDSTFTNNSSIADSECIGGGGAIAAGDDVYVDRSVFTRNSAVVGTDTDLNACGSTGHYGGMGGAIGTAGLEFITASTFTQNKASLVGGAIFSANIVPTRDIRAEITSSSFIGNDLLPLLGSWGYREGIGQAGSAVAASSNFPLLIESSTFSGNGHDGRADFEGISFSSCGSVYANVLEVNGSTFSANRSEAGGAICAGSLTMTDSVFTKNVASLGAGAIYAELISVQSSSFVKNVSGIGGAIYAYEGSIAGSTFKGNRARYGKRGTAWRTQTGFGGAVFAYSTITLTNNRFTGNRADRVGGAVYFQSDTATSLVLMKKNRFIANSAGKAGGAVGYNLEDTASLPMRSQIRKALRANRFSGNVATSGMSIGGLSTPILL